MNQNRSPTPIRHLHFEQLDSTSSEAARCLQAGEMAPFAVTATTQTAGRGRRGHDWQSPVGNLFLTLVLPPPVASEHFGLLPLKAAVVTARLLLERFGVRVTLKWPNDLLFAGRKLGGLLCELSSQGQAAGELLIGIGINLQKTPPADQLVDGYAAIAFADILPALSEQAATELATVFCERWLTLWDELQLVDVPAAFAAFSPGPEAIWKNTKDSDASSTNQYYRELGVAEDGTLNVENLTSGETLSLSSADHGLRWLYQGDAGELEPILIADIGNTATKLFLFKHSTDVEPAASISLPHGQLSASSLSAWFTEIRMFSGAPMLVHAVSVSPTVTNHLRQQLTILGIKLLDIPKRRLRSHGVYPVVELGSDRLALIEGALATAHIAKALNVENKEIGDLVILVSAGTAITVDAVSIGGADHGLHHGGLILPGVYTALHSLHTATALLPDLEAPKAAPAFLNLGQSTVTAMRQGVLHACVGAVRELVRRLERQQQNLQILVTGGDAALLAPVLAATIRPELIATGARAMVRGG